MIKIKAKKGGVELEYQADKEWTASFTQELIKDVVDGVIKIYEDEYREKENNQQD